MGLVSTCACQLVISKAGTQVGNRWSLRARYPAPSIAAPHIRNRREADRRNFGELIVHACVARLLKKSEEGKKVTCFSIFVFVREEEEEEEEEGPKTSSSVPTVPPTPTVLSFISSSRILSAALARDESDRLIFLLPLHNCYVDRR